MHSVASRLDDSQRRRAGRGTTLAMVLLALALVAGACSSQDEAGRAATSSINTGADDYFDADASTMGEIEVEVRLHHRQIEMAPSLPNGRVTFVVVNDDDEPHSFEIEGRGMEQHLESPVAPGEAGKLALDLEPGTYSVYCPEGDHRDQGMRRWLEVVR